MLTINSEFTQQQNEEDGKTLEHDKRDGAITCVFCQEFIKIDVSRSCTKRSV